MKKQKNKSSDVEDKNVQTGNPLADTGAKQINILKLYIMVTHCSTKIHPHTHTTHIYNVKIFSKPPTLKIGSIDLVSLTKKRKSLVD